MKMIRTANATKARSLKTKQKRLDLQQLIRTTVLPEFCCLDEGCPVVPGQQGCSSSRVRDCMSYKGIAGTLNALKVKTLRGKVGSWDVTMVRNLFKDEI